MTRARMTDPCALERALRDAERRGDQGALLRAFRLAVAAHVGDLDRPRTRADGEAVLAEYFRVDDVLEELSWREDGWDPDVSELRAAIAATCAPVVDCLHLSAALVRRYVRALRRWRPDWWEWLCEESRALYCEGVWLYAEITAPERCIGDDAPWPGVCGDSAMLDPWRDHPAAPDRPYVTNGTHLRFSSPWCALPRDGLTWHSPRRLPQLPAP